MSRMLLPCLLKTRISTASSATNMRSSAAEYPTPGWVSFRDRTRAPDAGGLRDHSTRAGSAGGVRRDARLEPGDLRRVRQGRADGDAARLPRACVLLLRRGAARGALR